MNLYVKLEKYAKIILYTCIYFFVLSIVLFFISLFVFFFEIFATIIGEVNNNYGWFIMKIAISFFSLSCILNIISLIINCVLLLKKEDKKKFKVNILISIVILILSIAFISYFIR